MNQNKENNLDSKVKIEKEKGNENINNEFPFDPNEINIKIIPRTIGQLVDMLEYNEILIPSYQRLPNLWSLKQKSRFIESLMLSLPIPLFYFDEGEDKRWRVIDGLQRMSTLEDFILSKKNNENRINQGGSNFKLQNLEFRTELNDRTWDELPRDVQRRIQTNQVTINLIGKGTPEQVKYNIFSRINQGGVTLKPQEIRTALFQGYKVDFIERLVSKSTIQGQLFLKATNGSITNQRQEDLDFASRFIAFYFLGYDAYEPEMDTFLTLGTKAIPQDQDAQDKAAEDFKYSMQLAYDIFGSSAFRKRKNIGDRKSPINKSLFEVISVLFSKLHESQRTKLLTHKNTFIEKFISLQNERKFLASITTGTASKERVKQRHEEFKKLVNQFI